MHFTESKTVTTHISNPNAKQNIPMKTGLDFSDKPLVFYQTLVLTVDSRFGDEPITVPTVCTKRGEEFFVLNPLHYNAIVLYLNTHESPSFFFEPLSVKLTNSELDKMDTFNVICYIDDDEEEDEEPSDDEDSQEFVLVERTFHSEVKQAVTETRDQWVQVELPTEREDGKDQIEPTPQKKSRADRRRRKRQRKKKKKNDMKQACVNPDHDDELYKCMYETLCAKVRRVLMNNSFATRTSKTERKNILRRTFDRMKKYRYFNDMRDDFDEAKKNVGIVLKGVKCDQSTLIRLYQSSLGHAGYMRRTLNIIPLIYKTNAYIEAATGMNFKDIDCPQMQLKALVDSDSALNMFSAHLMSLGIEPKNFILHYSLMVQSILDITFEKYVILNSAYRRIVSGFERLLRSI